MNDKKVKLVIAVLSTTLERAIHQTIATDGQVLFALEP